MFINFLNALLIHFVCVWVTASLNANIFVLNYCEVDFFRRTGVSSGEFFEFFLLKPVL